MCLSCLSRHLTSILLCLTVGMASFVEVWAAGLHLRLHRPPDVPLERLDRPLRESDRPAAQVPKSRLTQATVLVLAKAAMKEELGNSVRDYEVKSVFFDPDKQEWSVLFVPVNASQSATNCVTVFVDDESRETMLLRCR